MPLLKIIPVFLLFVLMSCGQNKGNTLADPVNVNSSTPVITNSNLKWNSVQPLVIHLPQSRKATTELIVIRVIGDWNSAIGRTFLTYSYDSFDENLMDKNLLASANTSRVYFKTRGQWASISSNPSTLATTYFASLGNQLVDADIIFNGDWDFSYNDIIPVSSFDFESVLLHEVGHFIGLPHIPQSTDPMTIMRISIMAGETLRLLSNGDIGRITTLYR
jgi:hypothetical protein